MGLFSSIFGKMTEEDQLKKKLADTDFKDPMQRAQAAQALEKAQDRSFGENVMAGTKDYFSGKARNLGFGDNGWSMETMMAAQKDRGSVPQTSMASIAAPAAQNMQLMQTPIAPQPAAIPQVPRLGGIGPSPALQQIQAAQQAYQQYGAPVQYGGGGILAQPSMQPVDFNMSIYPNAGQNSIKDRLLRMGAGG